MAARRSPGKERAGPPAIGRSNGHAGPVGSPAEAWRWPSWIVSGSPAGSVFSRHLAVVAVVMAEMLAMMLAHLGVGIQRGWLGLSHAG